MGNDKIKFSPFLLKSIFHFLLTDEDFYEKYFPILKEDHFNYDENLFTLAKAYWALHEQYNKAPSIDLFSEEIFVQKGTNIDLFSSPPSEVELNVLIDLFLEIVELPEDNKKYIEDNTVRILKSIAVTQIVYDNKQALAAGTVDVDLFAKEIIDATTFSTGVVLGDNLLEDLEKRTHIRNSSDHEEGSITFPIPEISNYLEDNRIPPGSICFIIAASNSGKCLGKDETVLMFDGSIKKASDIVVGDKLMGPDSTCRNVLATTKGIGQMYSIVPHTGKAWQCNDKHVLTLINSVSRRYSNRHSKKFRDIIDISVEDYLKKSNTFKNKYRLFLPDQIEFTPIEDPSIDPYFLGLYFGDGTKGLKNVSLTSMDVEISDYICGIAKNYQLNMRKNTKKGNKASTFSLSSKDNLGKFNILLDKLRILVGEDFKIPYCIKYGSVDTRLKFLAGFIDTDGNLNKSFYEIIQKREDYVKDLAFIARSLGLRANYCSCVKTIKSINFSGKYFRLNISGEISKIPVLLDRKRHTQLKERKQGKRTGFKVEDIGLGEYNGFELDGDGRFLLEDFTVTHNSSSLIYLAKEAAFRDKMNVLYVSAELTSDMVKKRFDSCITGVPINEVRKSADKVKDLYSKSKVFQAIASRLQIIEVPIGSTRVTDIENIINRLEKNKGFHTNVLIVDYLDNLATTKKSDAYRHELNNICKDLKDLANRKRMIVWTASQLNDAGSEASDKDKGVINLRHVNESRGKAHIADLMVGVARTQAEKDEGSARIILVKNRLGSGDGTVIRVFPDWSRARLYTGRSQSLDFVDVTQPIDGLPVPYIMEKEVTGSADTIYSKII